MTLLPALFLAASLAQAPAPREHFSKEGWQPLFDGRSLAGWVTTGGRYDGHAAWSVEEGVLVGRESENQGGLIYTERPYSSFRFAVDVWIDWPFDSGIFVHMVPPDRADGAGGKGAQVTIDYRPGGEVGALYADGFLAHNERAAELLVRDAWNHFEVECTGPDLHVRAWMNGEPITDYSLPPGTEGFAPRGLIGLQVHGGGGEATADSRVRFQNMLVLELPSRDPALFALGAGADASRLTPTAKARELGWQPLFAGDDFSGWEDVGGPTDGTLGCDLADGVLAFRTTGPGGYVRTRADYEDFELQLDFKTARMANSGLFLRGSRAGGDPAYSGCEIQILDDFNWEAVTGSTLEPYQFTGSLYGAVPRGIADALNPLGAWNTFQVRCAGSRISTRLNDVLLFDVDTHALAVEPAFAERAARGFIGLQRHAPQGLEGAHYAWFRNAFVRPLD